MPDEVNTIPARRTYTRWPWDAWNSGVDYRFAGEFQGKDPQDMATMWRNWARVHNRTVHVYFGLEGAGDEAELYVLLSLHPRDESHDRLDCERCGDERKMTSRRADDRWGKGE